MPESKSTDGQTRSEKERLRRRVKVAAQIACLEQYREVLTRSDQPAANELSPTRPSNRETTTK